MLKTLIKGYEDRFGHAFIMVVYSFTTLIPAVILFWAVDSYAEVVFQDVGFVQMARFGGPVAVFVFTFLLLARHHFKLIQPTTSTVTGTVLLDGKPLAGAQIYADGSSSTDTSKVGGYFNLPLNPAFTKWTLYAKYEADGYTWHVQHDIAKNQLGTIHKLELNTAKKKHRRAPAKSPPTN